MSIRSVMPGMLRLSSAVRIGPSHSRQRIVPFQRPSITDSAVSIGQSLTSFFDTGELSRPLAARWDRLHWLRVALLAAMFVLLTFAVA